MPSIVPSGWTGCFFQFGERLGRSWREADENDTDYETLSRLVIAVAALIGAGWFARRATQRLHEN
jgi:hypothetical protein